MKKIYSFIALAIMLLGGAISANAQNHYAEFVTNGAKADAWEWGVTYKLATPLVKKKTYVLTVDASCSDPSYTNLSFWPCKNGAGNAGTNYTGFGVNGNLLNRTCEFTAVDDLDCLVFNFGQMSGRLVMDNIKIVEKGVEGDLVNIDFESGFDSNWEFGWNKPTCYAVVEEYNPNPNHYLKLEKATGTANAWDRNLTYKLSTPLEAGETYVLTMKAKSSHYGGGDVPFWPYSDRAEVLYTVEEYNAKNGTALTEAEFGALEKAERIKVPGGNTLYTGVHVESEWTDCTKEFTANDDLNVITFKLGEMSGDFCVDDIKLVKKGSDVNLVPNGSDFEGGRLPVGWYPEIGWQQAEFDFAQIVEGYEDFKAEAVSAEVIATSAPWYQRVDGVYVLNNAGTERSYNVGSNTDCYFGKYWNSNNCDYYADLTNYSHIRVYQANSSNMPRVYFANGDNTDQVLVNGFVWNAAGYYELDLTAADAAAGNRRMLTLRAPSGSQTTCTAVMLVDPSLESDVAYILTGDPINGNTDASATAALADATAKIYDATGLTNGEATSLAAANPNAIFVTTAGKLSNAQNVMVDGVINNLAITDGKPFALPAEATDATAASYDRAFTAAYSTVCLPFNATFTGKAYECTAANAETVTFTEVEGNTLEAGKAYLVKADFAVTGGSGLAAPATAAFQGVYADTKNLNGKYGFSTAGEFAHITSDEVVCPAFRAYLTAEGAAAAKIRVLFSEETGIAGVTAVKAEDIVSYNIAGQRVAANTKGIVVINGKKFINK